MRHEYSCSGPTAAPATPRWRAALDALIAAPVRLHRYRHLHAAVIEDALRAFDGGPRRGNGK